MELNAVRFNPAARAGHVESFFLKANDRDGDRALWIRATIFASDVEPDRPVAEGWAIAFDRRAGTARHVAVKRSLLYEAASFGGSAGSLRRSELRSIPDIRWSYPVSRAAEAVDRARPDELVLTAGATSGRISRRTHRIAWDLAVSPVGPPIVPFPIEAMYTGAFPKTKTVTPLPDARFDGELMVDGERWSIDGWRGMQGHNWGRGHADFYAWSHANQWDHDEPFVLEGMSAKVRVGPLLTPLTTIVCARHRGVDYAFNAPLDVARTHAEAGLRRWEFSASNRRARIEGTLEAETDDFVGLYYPNPDGPMTYCLNTKLARARVRFEPADGPAVELSSRAAALEIGTRDEGHGVRMYV